MIAAVEPLDERHDLSHFQSGSPDFDRWLIDHSTTARGQGVRTYVALDDEGNVIGYVAIAPQAVERSELPSRIARGAPSRIPAVLLAKLARDVRFRGTGLGSELLVEALVVIVGPARQVGGRLVVVDAVDDAAVRLYEAHDFVSVPSVEQRLIMKLSTAAKVLGEPWP
jgi:ribosomal protein S18 acetylase RimI-like enzyme